MDKKEIRRKETEIINCIIGYTHAKRLEWNEEVPAYVLSPTIKRAFKAILPKGRVLLLMEDIRKYELILIDNDVEDPGRFPTYRFEVDQYVLKNLIKSITCINNTDSIRIGKYLDEILEDLHEINE